MNYYYVSCSFVIVWESSVSLLFDYSIVWLMYDEENSLKLYYRLYLKKLVFLWLEIIIIGGYIHIITS